MNPKIVDSHAHLNMQDFDKDRDMAIQRAEKEGVFAILCPAEVTDSKNLQVSLELIKNHKNVIAAGGVHPHNAKKFNSECSKTIKDLARKKKIHAVGEIGLDFYYNYSPHEVQKEAFRCQLKIAQELQLPAVIHSRNAGNEVADAIEEEYFTQGGVLHCFTEDWEFAKRMMENNFFISFSGILTYPNAHNVREAAKKIPLEKILVETDSPFLVPVPFRGKEKRNEPSRVTTVAKFLAELKDISLEKLAEHTTQNFESLFLFEI